MSYNELESENKEEEEKVCQYCGRETKEGVFCSEDCLKADSILKKYREDKKQNDN